MNILQVNAAIRPLLVGVSLFVFCGSAVAQTTWHVDDDCSPPGTGTPDNPYCTIQGAVDASQNGDTVLVAPGTYTGEGNRDISLFGKQIILTSAAGPAQTVIDVQGGPEAVHTGFKLIHGEPPETIIAGFTVVNGYVVGDTGGAGIAGGGGGWRDLH